MYMLLVVLVARRTIIALEEAAATRSQWCKGECTGQVCKQEEGVGYVSGGDFWS